MEQNNFHLTYQNKKKQNQLLKNLLKDSKKNLPKALVIGAFAIVAIYVFYYVGLAGAIPNAEMMAGGQAGAQQHSG